MKVITIAGRKFIRVVISIFLEKESYLAEISAISAGADFVKEVSKNLSL